MVNQTTRRDPSLGAVVGWHLCMIAAGMFGLIFGVSALDATGDASYAEGAIEAVMSLCSVAGAIGCWNHIIGWSAP